MSLRLPAQPIHVWASIFYCHRLDDAHHSEGTIVARENPIPQRCKNVRNLWSSLI
jgi:hypothetical protein